jgi:hypothetical protein
VDASLSTTTEVVTVLAAGETAAAFPEGADHQRGTAAVVAPAPTTPEEDTPRRSRIPAKEVTPAATAEGAATPVGVETKLVTSAAPR